MSVICPHCQTANSPKSRFCRTCGTATTSAGHDDAATTPSDASTATLPEEAVEAAPLVASLARPVEEAPPDPPSRPPTQVGGALTAIHPEPSVEPGFLAQVQSELDAALPGAESGLVEVQEEIAALFACNFNRLFIEGYNTTFQISLANQSAQPLEQILVRLECGAWEKTIERKFARIAPGQRQVANLDTLPTRAGNFLLKCTLKMVTAGRELAYLSSSDPNVTVMTKPDANNMVFNIVNNATNSNSGANAGLGEEVRFGDFNVRDLVSRDAIRSINDLIQLTLPPNFEVVELALDHELSIRSVEEFKAHDQLALTIPRQFVGFAHPGAILKLMPVPNADGSTPVRTTHLVARPVFRIGRRQDQSDLVAWFLPRNETNDGKTKRISGLHCSVEARQRSLWIVDHESPNYTTFDQDRVTLEEPVELNRRGVIGLSGEYFIDAMPFAASNPKGPAISNLRLWSGPPQTTERPPCGCVRFTPADTEPAFHEAIWLLADGTFGTSRSNPIVFESPGLAEIQGRFHHWRGCFWIENTIGNDMVRLAGVTLKSNEIVPLVNGLILELGNAKMRVEIGN